MSHWLPKRINLRMRFVHLLQYINMNTRSVHLFRIMVMILSQLRILYFLETKGRIPQWVRLARALYSEEVSVEEYVDDIFKLKRRYSGALLSLFERLSIHQTIKSR